MSKYTFVVEFEDGKEPACGAGTEILGGKLCIVAFTDLHAEMLTNDEASALLDAATEYTPYFEELCSDYRTPYDVMMNKLKKAAGVPDGQ
ncbi:hypothetical protein K1Y38_19105 [Serratia marcescens]|nr:hypothetical protein [Serratia marcescens]MCW6014931.1 hypothetical protein [Serratia marcescens]